MTQKDIMIAYMNGELQPCTKFEFIPADYTFNVHGTFYKTVIEVMDGGGLRKSVYNKAGEMRKFEWLCSFNTECIFTKK